MSSNTKSNAAIGSSLIILSSFFYASYGIWTTLMGDFFSGYTASAIRSVFVLMILIPIGLYRKELGSFELSKHWKKILAMIGVSALIWGLLYYSVLEAGIGISFSVNYAAIIIGMLFFGWLWAGEKFTIEKRWSAAIGIFGLLLIFLPTTSGSISALPLIAALVSGIATAANTVIAKQLPYNTTQATSMLWITSVIANTPMIFILNEEVPSLGLQVEWLYLIIFAVASVLASWLLMRGLKYIEAGLAGLLGILEIVFGIIFGLAFFSESIELIAAIGVVFVIVAAAYPYLSKKYLVKT